MSEKHRLDSKQFLVTPGKPIRLADFDPADTGGLQSKSDAREALMEDVSQLADSQQRFWASKEHSLIIIFQALDAAGKDGTIKHVMSGVNPQGVSVHSFKAPTEQERLHHFLWRPAQCEPERGRIAIFNRSYYEEVLVVRVHPEFLDAQFLPRWAREKPLPDLWKQRYESINQFEKTAGENNISIIKFFLNVSKQEQKARFLERLDRPDKHWKFAAGDVRERGHWDEYQEAYEEMLNATSTENAPWYVIPADKKWFMRAAVADIITDRIDELDVHFPTLSDEARAELEVSRQELEAEPETAAE